MRIINGIYMRLKDTQHILTRMVKMSTETIAKKLEETFTQNPTLQERLTELLTEVTSLRSDLESQGVKINENHADLTDQINTIEYTASNAEYTADEANSRSCDNESNHEDLQSSVEDLESNLRSLESDVSDIILTGNDK